MKNMTQQGIVIFLAVLLTACSDDEVNVMEGDYYPLQAGKRWEYVWDYGCHCPDNVYTPSEPVHIQTGADTTIDGKTYARIQFQDGNLIKLVRREGTKYYVWDFSGTEKLFLDTGVPVNGYWTSYDDGFWRTDHFVRKPLLTMTVKGKRYRNVFVVHSRTAYNDGTYSFTNTIDQYFAKDVGEILTVYPPNAYTYMSDYTFSLLSHQ